MPRTRISLLLVLGALVLPSRPAAATLVYGGNLTIIPGLVVFTNTYGAAVATHVDGFGSSTNQYGVWGVDSLPLGTPVDLSNSFSSGGGTSNSSVGVNFGITGSTATVFADPTTITLDQHDLDLLTANGPAVLTLSVLTILQFNSANPTEMATFDLDFDVSSTKGVLGASDGLAVVGCLEQTSLLPNAFITGGMASCGGTSLTGATLAPGASLPVTDPVPGTIASMNTNVEYLAWYEIQMTIKNDTGPVSLSLSDLTMTTAALPEPSLAWLLLAPAAALLARGKPRV